MNVHFNMDSQRGRFFFGFLTFAAFTFPGGGAACPGPFGDHILILSNSPGTVLKQIQLPPPDRPALEMQRKPEFRDIVWSIRDIIEKLESSNRAGD